MKRPQGFDRQAEPASGPFAPPRPQPESDRSVPRATAQPTTDAPVIELPAPHESGDGGSRDVPPVAHQSLRKARRERRRFERGEVRRFTRRTRRRRMIWLISLGSVVAMAAIAVLTAYSPLMALRTIDVVGVTRLKSADVQKALSGELGTPLPLVSSVTVKHDLARFPLIRSYSIETHPPGTLVVRIVERTPVGLLKTAEGYDLVDQAGVVISSSTGRPGGYPVIVLPAKQGSAEAKRGFDASAAVLAALPQSVLPQVDSVTAKTTDDVSLRLRSGTTVIWGSPEQSDLKSADLAALLQKAPGASSYDVSAPMSPVTG